MPPQDGVDQLDRAAERRTEDRLLDRLRADGTSRVVVVAGDAVPLASAGSVAWVPPHAVAPDAEWAFLGFTADGVARLVAVLADPRADPPFAAAAGWSGLRTVAPAVAPVEVDAVITALSLGRWLRDAPFCVRCGSRSEVRSAGWSRRCPACGLEDFPRTDPAVIVGVTSAADPDLLLLGANAAWGGRMYSCFAGFVEAGESLEATVHRELAEEAGVALRDVRYRGSQPWPFPRSLMCGFLATAIDDGLARPDGEEIVDVRWFHRDEIGAALSGDSDFALPGPASIAHRLIAGWHAEQA
ncbi:NAD(+) diphosphatase [Microbacterium awajiense]|uniref:NAD(+) diphosphatase n=1 Tax=Microbacterium awajiense TaxID=415214 RepID=A0ABP7AAA3_9MICO